MPPTGRSPEFLLLIKRAANEIVTFPMSSMSAAIKFRQRFHSFRKHLKHDASTNSNLAAFAELSSQVETMIEKLSEGKVNLIFRPADWEFREHFRNAGLSISDPLLPDSDLPAGASESSPSNPVERYLKKE